MTTYEVRFTIRTDIATATDEEVLDWVRFHLHERGFLDGTNPFIDDEPVAVQGSVGCYRRAAE
jgi:hypothetical protein